jgi:hypothetical protein
MPLVACFFFGMRRLASRVWLRPAFCIATRVREAVLVQWIQPWDGRTEFRASAGARGEAFFSTFS